LQGLGYCQDYWCECAEVGHILQHREDVHVRGDRGWTETDGDRQHGTRERQVPAGSQDPGQCGTCVCVCVRVRVCACASVNTDHKNVKYLLGVKFPERVVRVCVIIAIHDAVMAKQNMCFPSSDCS
jgi:hypothetical protein